MATLVEIAAQIVAAHASCSPMTSDQLLSEIGRVHRALKDLQGGAAVDPGTSLNVKEAFRKGAVTCLVCGKDGFKTLARHLRAAHGLTPGQYKEQFGIPRDQPLASGSYSEMRRKMASDRKNHDVLARARKVRLTNLEAQKRGHANVTKGKNSETVSSANAA